jgi:hypothetical protein
MHFTIDLSLPEPYKSQNLRLNSSYSNGIKEVQLYLQRVQGQKYTALGA